MLTGLLTGASRQRDEGEKPFWISFADLMTALMMLFLVVMSVSLMVITRKVNQEERKESIRREEIRALCGRIQADSKQVGAVNVDCENYRIDFGDKARFERGDHRLPADAMRMLREFIPTVLAVVDDDLGKRWLKRVVVEGFTDQDGTYLYNLNLSLKRSERVLCALFAAPGPDERSLSDRQKDLIRRLFLVGGYSFNSVKATKDESRRVELRLEFYGANESATETGALSDIELGKCSL